MILETYEYVGSGEKFTITRWSKHNETGWADHYELAIGKTFIRCEKIGPNGYFYEKDPFESLIKLYTLHIQKTNIFLRIF